MRIRTIGDLARTSPDFLSYKLGRPGLLLWERANGRDDEPVRSYYEKRAVKSVGNGITFSRDLYGMDELLAGLDAVCDLAAARMRQKKVKCTTVQLSIKDKKFCRFAAAGSSYARRRSLRGSCAKRRPGCSGKISILGSAFVRLP